MSNIVKGHYFIGEKIKIGRMKDAEPIKSITETCNRTDEPHEHVTVTNGPSFCGPRLVNLL